TQSFRIRCGGIRTETGMRARRVTRVIRERLKLYASRPTVVATRVACYTLLLLTIIILPFLNAPRAVVFANWPENRDATHLGLTHWGLWTQIALEERGAHRAA